MIVLRGEKVVLRSVERADLPARHALWGNVELVMLGNGRWSPEPLAAFEKRFEKELDEEDRAWFVIEADGKVIGGCGLHTRSRRDGAAALGIAIHDPDYVGHGYGRDAITVLLDWAFRIQNWRRIWLETDGPNERAQRCYRACGFVEEGRLRRHNFLNGEYVDTVVMGLLREEWVAQRERGA